MCYAVHYDFGSLVSIMSSGHAVAAGSLHRRVFDVAYITTNCLPSRSGGWFWLLMVGNVQGPIVVPL